jgi:hypothetical protein
VIIWRRSLKGQTSCHAAHAWGRSAYLAPPVYEHLRRFTAAPVSIRRDLKVSDLGQHIDNVHAAAVR